MYERLQLRKLIWRATDDQYASSELLWQMVVNQAAEVFYLAPLTFE